MSQRLNEIEANITAILAELKAIRKALTTPRFELDANDPKTQRAIIDSLRHAARRDSERLPFDPERLKVRETRPDPAPASTTHVPDLKP